MNLTVASHRTLALAAFVTELPSPLGALSAPSLVSLLRGDATAPVARSETLRADVRDMLREGGYKPTGRGKPASAYLVQAAERGALGAINLVVDACNVVSLHSGLPISVVDLARCTLPLRVDVAHGETYVFNAAGQTIDVDGLLCLFDAAGPCANAVKDSQRTKTSGETQQTLSLVWAPRGHERHVAASVVWYRELLASLGAATGDVTFEY